MKYTHGMNHFQMQIPLYECVICWESKYAVVLCKPEKGEHAVCADCTMCMEHVDGITKCPYCKALWDDTNSTKTWCNIPRQKQVQLQCDEDWRYLFDTFRYPPPDPPTEAEVDTFTETIQWGIPHAEAIGVIRTSQMMSFLGDVSPTIRMNFDRMENIMRESIWRASHELQEQQHLIQSDPAYFFGGAPATFIEKEGVWYRKTAAMGVDAFMGLVIAGRLGMLYNGLVIVYIPFPVNDDTQHLEIDGSTFALVDIVSLDEYHSMSPSKKEEFDANQPDILHDCMYLYLLIGDHSDNADE